MKEKVFETTLFHRNTLISKNEKKVCISDDVVLAQNCQSLVVNSFSAAMARIFC